MSCIKGSLCAADGCQWRPSSVMVFTAPLTSATVLTCAYQILGDAQLHWAYVIPLERKCQIPVIRSHH